MKYLALLLKSVFALLVLLFALATFMGGAYWQTLSLVLLVLFLFYWPKGRWSPSTSIIVRTGVILLIILGQFTLFKPAPKSSIYLSEEHRQAVLEAYEACAATWPEETEDIFLETEYGKVHVLALGSKELPPILLLHAASMGAHSWAENLEPLLGRYRIYAVDNIGEGNKSELTNPLKYPQNSKELAAFYAGIADALGIERSPVLGASNGGFIAQNYAFYYPERVESLVLFGPMGLMPLSGKSIFMLSVATMYPFQSVRDYVATWALGKDEYCHKKYGEWFDRIMEGTIPSVAQPVPMSQEQKQAMDLPILLFLGTDDPIVGDVQAAKKAAEDYPNIEIEVLESGHLVATEHRKTVNRRMADFLSKQNPAFSRITHIPE